ncbi:hypothetical protein J2744_000654 [Halorubrum trapanicum]|uniref:Uncharacterized protein n=1 Tax=Halorubrum trapanicum TaxID=29284 RepID=A0A8J7R557_9EURY|nr:hypothetical protein [Halorubrum trapanicum]
MSCENNQFLYNHHKKHGRIWYVKRHLPCLS